MCYTVIWLDIVTNKPYYSQEIASPDKKQAWPQIAGRSSTHRMLSLIPGHHSAFFNADGLTTDGECAILDTKLR